MRQITMCAEMKKLRNSLTDLGIHWKDASTILTEEHIDSLVRMGIEPTFADTSMYRTQFTYKDVNYSVINGYTSWGGYEPETGVNEGLLEMFNDKDGETVGCLTADDVLAHLKTV